MMALDGGRIGIARRRSASRAALRGGDPVRRRAQTFGEPIIKHQAIA
jgi:alkylation response protein AidB-like acyl-CoA dehydrogenase